jgi:hypothetical protein
MAKAEFELDDEGNPIVEPKVRKKSSEVVSEDAENSRKLAKLERLHDGLGEKIKEMIAAGIKSAVLPETKPIIKKDDDDSFIQLLRDLRILAPKADPETK